ncbi:MAG: hypothetical protein KAG53_02100 [Endozoicomonadaceae bacterium]|nr:hypothetical protein [Endozoicomonadaceae bacterium]
MNVGIVEPELQNRKMLVRLIQKELGWKVLWEVSNGSVAIRHCRTQKPELILIALTLPDNESSVEVIRQIMQDYACAIVITHAKQCTDTLFRGLSAGALDSMEMPSSKSGSLSHCVNKMNAVKVLVQDTAPILKAEALPPSGCAVLQRMTEQSTNMLIAIGCSTGGPEAVAQLLATLPADFPAAVVIVQHVDEGHALSMSKWLDSQIPMKIQVIEGGEEPQSGKVLLAKTNDHLVMNRMGRLIYTKEPISNPYRPSVDEFFCSAGQYWRKKMMAVLLTGMGRDGGRGLLALRRLGHPTFAQSEASCAIYGMPKDAIQRGAADEILDPKHIGLRLREKILLSSNTTDTQRGRRP